MPFFLRGSARQSDPLQRPFAGPCRIDSRPRGSHTNGHRTSYRDSDTCSQGIKEQGSRAGEAVLMRLHLVTAAKFDAIGGRAQHNIFKARPRHGPTITSCQPHLKLAGMKLRLFDHRHAYSPELTWQWCVCCQLCGGRDAPDEERVRFG
ncbi:hypothetical protein L1887_51886 [Cichorium endivia]|nr:hypothetical protein L1887_51886 [Cichorium endivia]